jgi:hypothetical protein
LPEWSRARDVLAGEDAIKAAKEKYLPKLDSQSDEDYDAYLMRASFFGATARTLEEFLDLIFRRAPSVSAGGSEKVKAFVSDCDLWGMDLVRYARRVVGEVLSVGRCGSLVCWAPSGAPSGEATPSGGALPSPGGSGATGDGRPFVSLWRAEDIINWKVERVGQRVVLVEVVLRDAGRVRVLKLNGTNGTNATNECVMEVWVLADGHQAGGHQADGQQTDGHQAGGDNGKLQMADGKGDAESGILTEGNEGNEAPGGGPPCAEGEDQRDGKGEDGGWVLQESVVLKRDGAALPFIPFVFHGPRNSRPEVDRLPLADIIAANLDHYRLDADFKHGLHFAALPTAWVSGFDKATPLRIGSSAAWVSDVADASAGFLEFSGAGLAHIGKALERVERRMALLGARMLATGVAANGEEALGETSGELCGLGSIVASLNQSLTRVLVLADGHQGEAAGVSFTMNTDLSARAISGEGLTAVVAAWRAGAISRESMLEVLKRGEVLPEGRSVAQERALIHGKLRES